MNTELKRIISDIGKQVDDAAQLDKVERLARQGHYIDPVTRKPVQLAIEKGDGLILDVDEAGNFFYRIRPRAD